jgi:hypothetical protein
MHFQVKTTTVSGITLPENHTCSENFILRSVANIYSMASPKIGLIPKYFTE